MMKNYLLPCCVVLLSCFYPNLSKAQVVDQTYNERIKEYTTDARFLPPSVLNLLDHPAVPSPLKHFGDIAGAPNVQHNTKEIYGYFETLAKASPYLDFIRIGTSEEGRPIHLAIICDEETMAKLDHYKAQLALLADPRKLDEKDLPAILDDAKPVYFINGGLHSPETGSPEMLTELAYRLITDEGEGITRIRKNVITLINPISEPDGWDRQTDWYYRYGIHRKSADDPNGRPPFWGKYTVHDNNRDGIQVSQELTKAVYRAYFEWQPTVFLDLHESMPLLYISSGTGPYNENIDPITVNEWHLLSQYEATDLAVEGLPGVFTWGFYDGWYPGYLFWIANNHNSNGRFYETFGNAGSNTFLRDITGRNFAGDPADSRQWYRPDPATSQVMWSIRNNLNYMQAGVLSALRYASINGRSMLANFYRKGLNSYTKGKTEKLKAYVIPHEQRDPAMAAYLVNQLRVQGIEVHKATSGQHAGDYVVLLDQPYRNLAVMLFEKQFFPKDAKYPSYDDVAWQLNYIYGVDVHSQDSVGYQLSDLRLLEEDVKVEGAVVGSGARYVINYKAQNAVIGALYKIQGLGGRIKLFVLDDAYVLGADSLGAGSVVIEGLSASQAGELVKEFGFDLIATDASITVKQHEVSLPRVAVYQSWAYTQDEGWVRYTLEQYGIPYTSIHKDHVKAGGLKDKFDVILIPRLRGSVSDFIHEIDSKLGPMPYTKTADYPSHGFPASTDDMTGGPGFLGLAEFMKFVESGGVIVPMDNSAMMVTQAGIGRDLSIKNTPGLLHAGSIVQAKARNSGSKILYGYPALFPIFRGSAPVLQVDKKNRDMIVLQYGAQDAKEDQEYTGPIMGVAPATTEAKEKKTEQYPVKEYPYVISGMVKNEEAIVGQGAIFNVPVGKGHVVAFTFNPLHRFLNHHDMPLVWNTLINWDNLSN